MHSTSAPALRVFLFAYAGLLIVYGTALGLQAPWATRLWMWPAAPELSNIFMASVMAATAAPTLWIAIVGDFAALRSATLNQGLANAGCGVYLLQEAARQDNGQLRLYGWMFLVALVSGMALYLYARRVPFRDERPMPALVRWSFLAFTLWLIPVGVMLVLGVPHVFPWDLAPDMAAVYGWIFLGASIYFIHGFLVPHWSNAYGQLLGFLAYDLVLLVPFFGLLGSVTPANRPSLLIYLVVITYSTVLAAYYLFMAPQSRPFRLSAR